MSFGTIKNLMMIYCFVIWHVPFSFFNSRTCSRTFNSDRHFPVPLYFPYRYGIAFPYLKFGPRANPGHTEGSATTLIARIVTDHFAL